MLPGIRISALSIEGQERRKTHTWRIVVANCKIVDTADILRRICSGIDHPIRAMLCRTSNLLRAFPHYLREMSPAAEVSHVWVIIAVRLWVVWHLAIVHAIADHRGSPISRIASADVLSIAASINRAVSANGSAVAYSERRDIQTGNTHMLCS